MAYPRFMLTKNEVSRMWSRVLLFVSLGKVFVAGAGLGLAALGIVDLAAVLGVKPVTDFFEHEHVLDAFGIGGGIVAIVVNVLWRVIGR